MNNRGAYSKVEINLRRRDAEWYAVELRITHPGDDERVVPGGPSGGPARVQFDRVRLQELVVDGRLYGEVLTEHLFADPRVKQAFVEARHEAQRKDRSLRVQLFADPSCPELHSYCWEALRDPEDGAPLFMGEQVVFSRYLSSSDWQPVRRRAQSTLNALAVIANPSGLDSYRPGGKPFAPVDVEGELARARAGLGDIPLTALASGGKATVNTMIDTLRAGYDVLYLVCHGVVEQGEPYLWLENDDGSFARIAGSELVARVRELPLRPRLVVLASCQSGGSAMDACSCDGGALSALGPSLAEGGIPAVLAMQGNVSLDTVGKFMSVFFRELSRDGQVDRAVAVARGVVRDRTDCCMPVLFMRLKEGRIWYVPGFAGDTKEFPKWPALVQYIDEGYCTPILGPGLTETMFGSPREIAKRWAEAWHFPMAPEFRDDLPRVAQYLSVNQSKQFPRVELEKHLRRVILDRYGGQLPPELQGASLDRLIDAAGRLRRKADPTEPHKVLAGLPFRIYITTNPDNLLESALSEAGKDPQVELCRWNRSLEDLPSVFETERDYVPDQRRPLVYHLFGRLRERSSFVLTEDDYFDYLIGSTSNKKLVPARLRRALADTALLFLGFQIDDWNFRVLLRSLMHQEGGRREDYAHVAVQIDPEEGRIQQPERARQYLESYFQGAHINIYWGSAEDFLKELAGRRDHVGVT